MNDETWPGRDAPWLHFIILHSYFYLFRYIPNPGILKPAVALPISALEISFACANA